MGIEINYDLKNSIINTLKKMGFPEKELNSKIIELFYRYFYYEEIPQFKNGKINLNFKNENIFGHRKNSKATGNGNIIQNIFDNDLNWNIVKLFTKQNIINVINPKILTKINIYIKSIIFNTIRITRLFDEQLVISSYHDEFKFFPINYNSYEHLFNYEFDESFKKYTNKIYCNKHFFLTKSSHFHDHIEFLPSIKNIYDHFDGIYFELLKSIKLLESFLKKNNLNIFNLSSQNFIMDSFTDIFFSVFNFIDRQTKLTKSDFLDNFDSLVEPYIKLDHLKELFGVSNNEKLLKFLYAYQFKKTYRDSNKVFESLLLNYTFPLENEIPKKIHFAYTIETKQKKVKKSDFFKKYTKDELFQYVSNEPINNPYYKESTKYKKFKSNIERLEEFLKHLPNVPATLDLRSYSFIYKEFIETKDKYDNKAIPKLIIDFTKGKTDQNITNYLLMRLNRAIYVSDHSFEEYKNKIEFKIKLREIITSNFNSNPEEIKKILIDILQKYEKHNGNYCLKFWYVKPTENRLEREFPYI